MDRLSNRGLACSSVATGFQTGRDGAIGSSGAPADRSGRGVHVAKRVGDACDCGHEEEQEQRDREVGGAGRIGLRDARDAAFARRLVGGVGAAALAAGVAAVLAGLARRSRRCPCRRTKRCGLCPRRAGRPSHPCWSAVAAGRAAAQPPRLASVRRRRRPVLSSRTTRRTEMFRRLATPSRERGGAAPRPARSVRTRLWAAEGRRGNALADCDRLAKLTVTPRHSLCARSQRRLAAAGGGAPGLGGARGSRTACGRGSGRGAAAADEVEPPAGPSRRSAGGAARRAAAGRGRAPPEDVADAPRNRPRTRRRPPSRRPQSRRSRPRRPAVTPGPHDWTSGALTVGTGSGAPSSGTGAWTVPAPGRHRHAHRRHRHRDLDGRDRHRNWRLHRRHRDPRLDGRHRGERGHRTGRRDSDPRSKPQFTIRALMLQTTGVKGPARGAADGSAGRQTACVYALSGVVDLRRR